MTIYRIGAAFTLAGLVAWLIGFVLFEYYPDMPPLGSVCLYAGESLLWLGAIIVTLRLLTEGIQHLIKSNKEQDTI